jgi:hypothetical protein
MIRKLICGSSNYFVLTGLLIISTCIQAQPAVTSISANNGTTTTKITITGSGFNSTASKNVVYFGNAKGTVSTATSSQLEVYPPAAATYGNIRIVNTDNNLCGQSREKFLLTYGGSSTALSASKFSTSRLSVSGLASMGSKSTLIRRNMGIGDFNGDGSLDIVVMDYSNKKLKAYRNRDTGAFNIGSSTLFSNDYTYSSSTNTPYDIDIVDFNNDGKLDVIVATSQKIYCYLNNSSGSSISFSNPSSFTVPSSFAYLKSIDMNNDGKLDIVGYIRVSLASGASTIYVYPNSSTSTSNLSIGSAYTISVSSLMDLDCADMNSDGKNDIIFVNNSTSANILLNKTTSGGSLSFETNSNRISISIGSGESNSKAFAVKIADLNLDGKNDIIVGLLSSKNFVIFQNNISSGTLSSSNFGVINVPNLLSSASSSITSYVIDVADFDGDGKPDIAHGIYGNASSVASGSIALVDNNNTSATLSSSDFTVYKEILPSSNAGTWSNVFTGDIDLDGKPDLISTCQNKYINVLHNDIIVSPTITSTSATGEAQASTNNFKISWESNTAGAISKIFTVKVADFSSSDKVIMNMTSSTGTTSLWKCKNSISGGSATSISTSSGVCIAPGTGSKTVTFEITYEGVAKGTYYCTLTFRIANSSCTASGATYTYTCTVDVEEKVYKYSGESYSDLFSGSNVTPANSSPTTNDVLNIDKGDTQTVVVKTNNTVKAMKVVQGTSLTIDCSKSGGSKISIDSTFEIEDGATVKIKGSDTLRFEIKKGAKAEIKGVFETESSDGTKKPKVVFEGEGEVHFKNDVRCGSNTRMEFKHSDKKHVHFDGDEISIEGDGDIDFDEHCHVHFGGSKKPKNVTVKKPLHCKGKITLEDSVEIVSNAPLSDTEDDWNAWQPAIQLKNDGKNIGSIDTLGDGATIAGGVLWEMWNSAVRSFRTVAFPLANGMNLSQITDNLVISGTTAGQDKNSNRDSFTTSCSWCKPSCYYWNETTSQFVAYQSGNAANRVELGQGILLFFRGMSDNGLGDPNAAANSGAVDIKGQIHTGTFVKSLTYNGAGSLKGYNLVGNPYPANIDFQTLIRSNVSNYFQIYDPRTKSYNIWNKTTGTLYRTGSTAFTSGPAANSSIIEAGAAFFAVATNATSTITFTEQSKTNLDPNTTAFKIEPEKLRCNVLKGQMDFVYDTFPYMDAFQIEWDAAYPNSKLGWDEYEVRKFHGGYVGIGPVNIDNEWLSMENRPYTEQKIQSFPLKTKSNLFTTLKIKFNTCPESKIDTTYIVTLVDKLLDSTIQITDSTEYVFVMNKTDSKTEDRFDIVIKRTNESLDIETTDLNTITAKLYPVPTNNGSITIEGAKNAQISKFTLFNLQGQEIYSNNLKNSNEPQLISLPKSIPDGIYFVATDGKNQLQKTKIIVER